MRKCFGRLRVIHQEELAPSLYHAEFISLDEPLKEVSAGQFLMLRCDPADPYTFMRPMSILTADGNRQTLEILYRVFGEQTRKLADAKPGTVLPAVFPLGVGFSLPEDEDEEVVGVAGGTGIPPLLLLAETLGNLKRKRPRIFFGARTKEQLALDFLGRWQADFVYSTDDGSFGYRGTVVELFTKALQGLSSPRIYACGPRTMLTALKRALPEELKVKCQVSLEEVMACGIGACYGCAVKCESDAGSTYKLVCKDGPVFQASQVVLDS